MILCSYYFIFPLFSKPTLPIEVGYHLKNSDEVIVFGDANDNSEDDDDDPLNWSPENILQNMRIGQELTVYDSKFSCGDLLSSLIHQLAVIYSKLQQKKRGTSSDISSKIP